MKFSQIAGTSIVPTLSRLVLALAFVTTGYNKLMTQAEFGSADAETLRTLGVDVVKITDDPVGDASAAAGGPLIVLASLQETPEEGGGEPVAAEDEAEAPPEGGVKAVRDAIQKAAETIDAAVDDIGEAVTDIPVPAPPLDDGTRYTARGVHNVTLMCHKHNWPAPRLMGYAAGVTELLGGGLILIGFLTRIWAMGLAITMGVAFYFVSMGVFHVHETNPFTFATEHVQFNAAAVQLALFVLSFGLVMTGAGPLSLDRLLFGRRGSGKKKDAPEIEYDDAD